jgi:hypothetical protein
MDIVLDQARSHHSPRGRRPDRTKWWCCLAVAATCLIRSFSALSPLIQNHLDSSLNTPRTTILFAALRSAPVQSVAKHEPLFGSADNLLIAREERSMFGKLLNRARQMITTDVQVLQDRLPSWTKPASISLTPGVHP